MRILFEVIFPILLPALIYLGYSHVERRRAAQAGDPANPVPWWVSAPWLRLAATGVALAALVLGIGLWRAKDSGLGIYVPAHMENGHLVPGRIETAPPTPPRK